MVGFLGRLCPASKTRRPLLRLESQAETRQIYPMGGHIKMSTKYLRYLAAFHTMIGRSQASRRAGNLPLAALQLNAASRIFSWTLNLPL